MGDCHRCVRIRLADLRRLQWLQRLGQGQRAIAGIPFHGEFPPALSGGQRAGLLATMAHESGRVAAELSLFPIGRVTTWTVKVVPKSDAGDAGVRRVAWCDVGLCAVGVGAWDGASGASVDGFAVEAPQSVGVVLAEPPRTGGRVGDDPKSRAAELDSFPRDES